MCIYCHICHRCGGSLVHGRCINCGKMPRGYCAPARDAMFVDIRGERFATPDRLLASARHPLLTQLRRVS